MIGKSDFRVLIVYPNLSMMLTPSYAVALFTSILRTQGYSVDLFDATPYRAKYEFMGEPLPDTRANKLLNSRRFDAAALYPDVRNDLVGDFARKLDEFKPHAAVFSTLVEDTWPQATELLEVLAHSPEIKTLIGGVFTTMAPEVVIAHPHVRCIGTGEGEETIVEFCERVRQGGDLTRIAGTVAKADDGTVIRNTSRPLVDVNKVVAEWSFFAENRFYRPLGKRIWKTLPLETYRGCPYTCSFCNSPSQVLIARESQQGYFLRRKSIQTLRREIEIMIARHAPEFIYIVDDAFMARPKSEIVQFAEMYKEFRLPFWFQTRLEDIDEEKLTRLRDVNCYRISFGLEHGNEKFRREIVRRNITNAKILAQCDIVARVGIPYTLNNIVGFPYETRDLFFETIELNRQISTFDSLSVNIFVPYHGTEMRTMALREGWLDPDRQTTSVIAESILEMPAPYLSAKEILGLQRAFPLYVKLPRERYPEIRKVERFDDEGNAVFEALSKEYYQLMYGEEEVDRRLTYAG